MTTDEGRPDSAADAVDQAEADRIAFLAGAYGADFVEYKPTLPEGQLTSVTYVDDDGSMAGLVDDRDVGKRGQRLNTDPVTRRAAERVRQRRRGRVTHQDGRLEAWPGVLGDVVRVRRHLEWLEEEAVHCGRETGCSWDEIARHLQGTVTGEGLRSRYADRPWANAKPRKGKR